MSLAGSFKSLFDEESDIEIEGYEDFDSEDIIEIKGSNKSKAKSGIVSKIKSFYLKHLEKKRNKLEEKFDELAVEAAANHDSSKLDKAKEKIDALESKIDKLNDDINGVSKEEEETVEEEKVNDQENSLDEEQNKFEIPEFLKNTLNNHKEESSVEKEEPSVNEEELDSIEKEINAQIKKDVNDMMEAEEKEETASNDLDSYPDIAVGENSEYESADDKIFNSEVSAPIVEEKKEETVKERVENAEKAAHDDLLEQFENNCRAKMMEYIETMAEDIRREDEKYYKGVINKVIDETSDKMRTLDATFQNERANMQVEINTLKNSYEAEKEKSESQAKTIEENNATINDLNRGLKFANETIDGLNDENEKLRAQIASLEGEKKALRVTVSTLMREGLSPKDLVNDIPNEEIEIPKTL